MISFNRLHVGFHILTKMIPNIAHQNDHCSLIDKQGVVEKQHILSTYVYNHSFEAALDMRLTYHHQNQVILSVNIAYKILRLLKYCSCYPNSIKRTSIEASANSTY